VLRLPRNPSPTVVSAGPIWTRPQAISQPWGNCSARLSYRNLTFNNAGRLHSREHARGHVQPRCRGGGRVGRGKGCHRRHRSGGSPPASRDADQRGRHSAAQRTCAWRAGRPTRRTGGRVGPTAARRGAFNRAARWRQKLSTSRRYRSWRAGTITRGSSWARQAPKSLRAVAARNSGRWGGAGGQTPCDPCGRTVLLSHVTIFAFSVMATLPTLTRLQLLEETKTDCHLWNGEQVP